ncbi:hypothetical protein BDR07DRAFT_1383620 [Suillus spraguei]|nr:hypothetical protein BDR07DRAFT_1383620 [Suillus spraguei]
MVLVRTDRPRDPLDLLSLCRIHNSGAFGHGFPWERSTYINTQTTQSSATASTTFKSRLHHLSTRWPARAGHALPPIVDVSLSLGKLRYVTAGAPTLDDDLIRTKTMFLLHFIQIRNNLPQE